jgi:hypothetical protein
MSANIKIIHAHDFIKAAPEGQLDLENCKIALTEIAAISAATVDYEIILDTRKAQVRLSIADLWHLAAELSKLGKPFSRKTAVVCPLEGFDNAGFLALCAQNRGVQVKAFTSFDDAIEWLFAKDS